MSFTAWQATGWNTILENLGVIFGLTLYTAYILIFDVNSRMVKTVDWLVKSTTLCLKKVPDF